jgi:uncharacterized protein
MTFSASIVLVNQTGGSASGKHGARNPPDPRIDSPGDRRAGVTSPSVDPTPLARGRVLLHRDVGITTEDGVRLSADVYLPADAERSPAILEHIPYRKADLRAADDRGFGVRLASDGFAYVRLDVRGTGNSAGIAVDEYTEREQLDGVAAVAWISRQRWCTGAVGSWGKSYGGFSALQLASHRPPALRAVAAVYATDDRYTDDMHFSGGAPCALELAHYPMRILAMNALPPLRDASESEEDFRARWLDRIETTPAWIERWIAEQTDGTYWRNGSVAPDYARIRCPVFLVAGWRDGYRTAMLRLAGSLRVEWQLLAGPWMHTLPDRGVPGPRYPFLDEMVGWFRRHLTTNEQEHPGRRHRPRTVFFLNGFDAPSRPPSSVSGRWMASDRWPESALEPTVLWATPDLALRPAASGAETILRAPFDPSVGVTSGNWCPPPPGHGLPGDQRPDESRSIVFTSEPLVEPVDVLGAPSFSATISHPGPAAVVSVKLADVAPDGQSQLVTSGVLNLSHRDSHREPRPFHGSASVEIPLQATGWRFARGHRIRLAVAASDWPTVWPPPTDAPIEIHLSPSTPAELRLPPLPGDARPFEVAEPAPYEPDAGGWIERSRPSTWRIVTDSMMGASGIEASDASWSEHPEERIRAEEIRTYRAFISAADPLDGRVDGSSTFLLDRGGQSIRSEAAGVFGGGADTFTYDVRLEVDADGERVASRRWSGSVPRRLC